MYSPMDAILFEEKWKATKLTTPCVSGCVLICL
jgi:hypothetical protein